MEEADEGEERMGGVNLWGKVTWSSERVCLVERVFTHLETI